MSQPGAPPLMQNSGRAIGAAPPVCATFIIYAGTIKQARH